MHDIHSQIGMKSDIVDWETQGAEGGEVRLGESGRVWNSAESRGILFYLL